MVLHKRSLVFPGHRHFREFNKIYRLFFRKKPAPTCSSWCIISRAVNSRKLECIRTRDRSVLTLCFQLIFFLVKLIYTTSFKSSKINGWPCFIPTSSLGSSRGHSPTQAFPRTFLSPSAPRVVSGAGGWQVPSLVFPSDRGVRLCPSDSLPSS